MLNQTMPQVAAKLGSAVTIWHQSGAANLITFVGQNFGNTAHAGTANANKVNVPDATHLGHDRTQFCQILCIHSLRHQLLYSDGDHHRD